MLKPEQANARLDEWRLPKDEDRIAAAVKQLPGKLKALAERVFWQWTDEELAEVAADETNDKVQERKAKAIVEIDQLPAKERASIFDVLSPELAPHLERAWQLLKTTPYQTAYNRKAFRAPGRPELMTDVLLSWMIEIAQVARRFPATVLTPSWLATWSPYLSERYRTIDAEIGAILATILSEKGNEADEVFAILLDSLNNRHEIGAPGRHIYTAFLLSERVEAWEAVEKTLLAAQRQEGLRQSILEAIDLSHPTAFRRMLRLILDHDLQRFSAVIRAVDVWFGGLWAAANAGVVKKMIAQLVELLDDPMARTKALASKDPNTVYLALWCTATEDALASVPLAEKLLGSKSMELRYVAARHLANLGIDEARVTLLPALGDDDLRVAIMALTAVITYGKFLELKGARVDDRFERLELLVDRVPVKPQKLKPLVWPWTEISIQQSHVAGALLQTLGDRPATRLIPHLRKFHTYARPGAAKQIVSVEKWDDSIRQAAIEFAGDASSGVREVALEALAKHPLQQADIERLEGYLTRKTSELRRGVVAVLMKQSDEDALASGARLLAAKDANQRLAGLELLRLMTDENRSAIECRKQAASYESARKKVNKDEKSHLDEIAREKKAVATLENALGLMNSAERTAVVPPRDLNVLFVTPAAVACLKSLDDLVHEHRETSIKLSTYVGERDELLGNVRWNFPSPDTKNARDKEEKRLPLAIVWQTWYAKRGKELIDNDGLELVRALAWCAFCDEYRRELWTQWAKKPARTTIAERIAGGGEPVHLRYSNVVRDLLEWLLFLHRPDARDYVLDAVETAFSLVPEEDMARIAINESQVRKSRSVFLQSEDDGDWRDTGAYEMWSGLIGHIETLTGYDLTREQQVRRWRLMHWQGEPFPRARRRRPPHDLLQAAYTHKAATLADVADDLLGPRSEGRYTVEGFDFLASVSSRRRDKSVEQWIAQHREVRALIDAATAKILELELGRGDAPTAATAPANALGQLLGIETLRRILHALGKTEFKLGPRWRGSDGRRETLTQLAKITHPDEKESPDEFVAVMEAAVKEGQFPEERLLQLVFLAPQWTKFIEKYFGWERMSEGVYWFLAHMRYVGGLGEAAADAAGGEERTETAETTSGDSSASGGDAESAENDGEDKPKRKKLSAWERLILERTPLTDSERGEGAIDVPWFQRTYADLGDERWQRLAAAARFAANASQANRAKFIAEVLLNRVTRKALIDGIKNRQLKDNVRLLGLLPLAKGKKGEADLLERCRVLREYRRYANGLSGLTKPAAMRAWEIGMRNMAQTAGYADPLRLEWAVGAEAVKDLAKGPLVATKGDVIVTLTLDEMSKPVVTVCKGDKVLKSIPPAIKKDKKIAELTGRVTELRKQAAGIRQSLEAAMCRGDIFTGTELREWCGHAMLVPMLSRLIVMGEGIMGYPDKQGKALRDFRGKLEPVKATERLRIAHPHDLLKANEWHEWQRECFHAERVQPFKQVFRELYVITQQEQTDGGISHRYDGHQVQTKQALALFGQRGWNTQEGVFKVFHDLQLTANVHFNEGVTTPAEVEGPALAGVTFTKRDEFKPIPLKNVPPRLFSEVMRDVDLVVSVAHAGGVDPEASASTVEMRGNLLRETCALLKLENVRFKPTHALIDGELATYSVHLGSGSVQKMPGGALCVVPVHAQHRGRLFLPFADDDPRTAEVISKVLLLARDREIQDPTILEQIRA